MATSSLKSSGSAPSGRRTGGGWRRCWRGRGRLGRGAQRRRAAGPAGALSLGAVVAVGGAGDLARPQPDRLSREPVDPRLFLRLRRARPLRERLSGFFAARLAGRGAGALARDRWSRSRSRCSPPSSAYSAGHARPDWFDGLVPGAGSRAATRPPTAASRGDPVRRPRRPAPVGAGDLPVHPQRRDRHLRLRARLRLLPADGAAGDCNGCDAGRLLRPVRLARPGLSRSAAG